MKRWLDIEGRATIEEDEGDDASDEDAVFCLSLDNVDVDTAGSGGGALDDVFEDMTRKKEKRMKEKTGK